MNDRKRSKRVGQIKKLILALLVAGLLIPICIGVLLVAIIYQKQDREHTLAEELKEAFHEDMNLLEGERLIQIIFDDNDGLQSSKVAKENKPDMEEHLPQKESAGQVDGVTKVYLTFDDGPSSNTADILDVLKEYNVKATFFVTGKEGEQYDALYKRMVEEGHTVGIHSFSHKYDEIYASGEAFWTDFEKLQEFLYDKTGKWPRFYRFPGGSSNRVSRMDMKELISQLREQDISYLDWNISCGDAAGEPLTKEQIADNVTGQVKKYQTAVVLMHDAADKKTTVSGLRLILERLTQMEQVEILPATDDMELIQHLY